MKTSLFIAVVLLAGAIGGLVQGLVNLAIVEPFLASAINVENQNLFKSGEEKDTPDFWVKYYSYRVWQKNGEVLAGTILGVGIGSLFGLVFGLSRNSLPSNNFIKKALLLALIMWATLYVIPFAKYPANPPTVGEPDTLVLRQTLYVGFIAISGLGALGFYQVYKRTDRKIIAFIGYAVLIGVAYFMMPQNPDPVNVDSGLLAGFRATSMIGVTSFWVTAALVLGALWKKLNLEQVSQTRYK